MTTIDDIRKAAEEAGLNTLTYKNGAVKIRPDRDKGQWELSIIGQEDIQVALAVITYWREREGDWVECPRCEGKGYMAIKTRVISEDVEVKLYCSLCNGKGRVPKEAEDAE